MALMGLSLLRFSMNIRKKKRRDFNVGADDLASFVVKSRTCFEDDELAIAAIFPAESEEDGHASDVRYSLEIFS